MNKNLILYIEDNLTNTELVKRVLKIKSNYSFISASRAQHGIKLALQHKPDIILLDIQMPEMDGITAFKHLRNLEEIKSIPIIAVSADAAQANIQEALEMGFHSYITKPINLSFLLEVIESIFDSKK